MTEMHLAPAINLLAAVIEPRASESVNAPPLTPALIIGLCVVAGLATWLALPSKKERAIRAIGGVILAAVGLVLAGLLVRWTSESELGGMSLYFWLFSAVALFASVRVITHNKPVYSALYFVLTVFATGGLFVLLWAEFIAAALVLIYAGAILITYVFVIMLASEASTGGVGSAAERISDHDANSRDPFLAALTGFAVTGLLIFVLFDKATALDRRDAANKLYADGHVEWKESLWHSGQQDNIFTARSEKTVASVDEARSLQATGTTDSLEKASPVKDKAVEKLPDLGSAQELGRELLDHQALNIQLAAIILTVAMVGAITLARRRVLVVPGPAGQDLLTTPGTPADDNPKTIAVYGTDNPRHKAYPEN